MEVSKSDWKLFRDRLPQWQENYMGQLCEEYITILSKRDENPSSRFWELEKRIKEDKHLPGVRLELSKRSMPVDIISLINDGAISIADLDGFSDELVDYIKGFIER